MQATLVVGLGGTGSWALTHLKQRLVTDHRWQQIGRGGISEMARPDYDKPTFNTVLRALDVDRKTRPAVSQGVSLDSSTEDLAISGPIGKVIEDIQNAEGRWPTIEAWLPTEDAKLMEINDALKFQTEGAGQIRQFGRIAFFLDVLHGAKKLGQMVSPLLQLATGGDVQVIVVGSVAGGTGAGMLVDTLAYLHNARKTTASEVNIRTSAFVVLPGAFKGVATQADELQLMRANGRAALRELDRLMNAPETASFKWVPSSAQTASLSAPAADVCYLLDGSRDLGAPPLEGQVPFEAGLPVAIADAIYTHVFPSMGAKLGSSYVNRDAKLVEGTPARYSSFGTYSVNYGWEPLMRSLGLRGVSEVVEHLLQDRSARGRDAAKEFLSTGATGSLAVGQLQQEIPAFAAEALSPVPDAMSLVIPGSAWLEPRGEVAAPVPFVPNLSDNFPGLGRLRTDYANPDVVAQATGIIDDFWGDPTATWNQQGTPSYHEAANSNMGWSQRHWKRAVYLATVALMNENAGVGGVTAAQALLATLQARLEEFSETLARMPSIDLVPFRDAVDYALNEMNDNRRFDDYKEQRDFLQARQDLLEQEIADENRRRVADLAGRFLATVKEIQSELNSWADTLRSLREQASDRRRKVDDARRSADASPVQRWLPLPGDAVEEQFWTECWGIDGTDQLAAGVRTCLDALAWKFEEGPNIPDAILLNFSSSRNERTVVSVDDLMANAVIPFVSLRTRSIWEVLDRAGQTAGDLVSEIEKQSARYAVFDPSGQVNVDTGDVRASRDWDFVFASWISDDAAGRGAALSRDTRERLAAKDKDGLDLAAGDRVADLPTTDKIMVFTARHLVTLESFTSLGLLDSDYRARVTKVPRPHVLPEEIRASRLEVRSETLAREGKIKLPLPQLDSRSVALCGDLGLLAQVGACLADGVLAWKDESDYGSEVKKGAWMLGGESGTRLSEQLEFQKAYFEILHSDQFQASEARAAIKAKANEIAADSQKLVDFAASDAPVAGVPDGIVHLIRVAMAELG